MLPPMPENRYLAYACWTSAQTAMVRLSRDWRGRRLPPLYWGRERVPLRTLEAMGAECFSRVSGYRFDAGRVCFELCARRVTEGELGSGVYLAGSFNGWGEAVGDPEWRLEMVPRGGMDGGDGDGDPVLRLEVGRGKVLRRGPGAFKFVTGSGRWLEVPGDAPNAVTDAHGNRNHWIRSTVGGQHQFRFTTPSPLDTSDQSLLIWDDGTHEETCLLMPGDFLFRQETTLPLGAIPTSEGTLFRIFAPRAHRVRVHYHPPGNPEGGGGSELRRVNPSTWEVLVPRPLGGWYYHYSIAGGASDPHSHFDPDFPVLDPYALAAVGPLGPGIVVDPARMPPPPTPFDPPAWHDLVVAEAHLRDLTANAPLEIPERERMGFSGLRQWVESPHFYLSELGVNAVELQPLQLFDAVDAGDYHWGYMTNNYFCPASQYAADPGNASGLQEMRDLVEALHRRGLAVILDVVYNHVGEPNHLQYIDKHYYFDLDQEGRFMNWSGCGNTLRADTPMARRLIIDSLLHWVRHFGIDGFRFDLAELLGVETLVAIERALKQVKPSIILIAEPWSFRGHIGPALRSTGFSSWNDGYREFLLQYAQGLGNAEGIRYFMNGSLAHLAAWPAQTVNYTESHDDRTWIDRLTSNPGHNGTHPTPQDRRRTHLMCAALMASLGIPMIASGQDFLRSKGGFHNSYLRGDLNALDYDRMVHFSSTHQYFRDWIAFRLSPEGRHLRLAHPPSPGFQRFFFAPGSSAVLVLYNADFSQGNDRILLALNPHPEPARIETEEPLGEGWLALADTERLNPKGLPSARPRVGRALVTIPPLSCALWRQA